MKNILTILLIFLFLFGCKLFGNRNAGGAETLQFVNSRGHLTGKLAENYIDFSFNYPKSWKIDPETQKPGSSNFTKVEKLEEDFTLENFAVGYLASTGTPSGDKVLFPQLASQLNSQFSKGFPEYKKVSEGNTRIGSYDAYEFRFTAMLKGTPKGDVPIWGRAVMIPHPAGKKNGVSMIMLATPFAAELKSVNDVGVKGELPVILNSFKLD